MSLERQIEKLLFSISLLSRAHTRIKFHWTNKFPFPRWTNFHFLPLLMAALFFFFFPFLMLRNKGKKKERGLGSRSCERKGKAKSGTAKKHFSRKKGNKKEWLLAATTEHSGIIWLKDSGAIMGLSFFLSTTPQQRHKRRLSI